MSKKFSQLVDLLKQLFQLDRPELDFGMYRIMHAKSAEVTQFLEEDLLGQVREAFSVYESADKVIVQRELEEMIANVEEAGMDPEESPKVQELRRRLRDETVDLGALEADVYDHLYRFFRRYYEDGDFISKRVYKDDVYAIPYEGEEVKLHWANHDQYYIKTGEYFRDYAFRLSSDTDDSMRVRFQLVDAAEGAHNNVKESKNRVFVLAEEDFWSLGESDAGPELTLCFEFRPTSMQDWPEGRRELEETKSRPQPPKQPDMLALAKERIFALTDKKLQPWLTELARPYIRSNGEAADYSQLRAQLERYTKLNTSDYFIHKDLGGFLRRELDFYIKNEVMHLDDIDGESAPRVEQFLSKIKVIRRIAHKLIDFLAQLEDFQKKLWLKKKFVTETSWNVRLDIIPEEFYPEICGNDAQRQEWVQLHGIDEFESTPGNVFEAGAPAYTNPLTPDFLRAYPTLMVDTRHFSEDFTARLLESIGDIDETIAGVLVHSENFQALNLMQARYRERIQCVYIDPPYNTGEEHFLYKDGYAESSWAAMLFDRAVAAHGLIARNGLLFLQIGDQESAFSRLLLDKVFAERKNSIVARRGIKNVQAQFDDISRLALGHDVIHVYAVEPGIRLPHLVERHARATPGKWDTFWRGTDRPSMRYELFGQRPDSGQWRWQESRAKTAVANYQQYLQAESSRKSLDDWYVENLQAGVKLDFVRRNDEGVIQYYVPPQGYRLLSDNWLDVAAGGSFAGFATEKSVDLLERILSWNTGSMGDVVLDFFAGSGTAGHAVINLNREDGGSRRFILVEMGDYFDTVLVPRLKKVAFTPEWRQGKPARMATAEEAERGPRLFQIVRLESYEDTLNNLELKRTPTQAGLFERPDVQGPGGFREQYILRYMLDVETRGSPSLLNVDGFMEPTQYQLRVQAPGSDESRLMNVDLLETFNWLLGLRVRVLRAPRRYNAQFIRAEDPDLPDDSPRRLLLKEELQEDPNGPWWFRSVEGETRDGRTVLVLWRNRPGGEEPEGVERDNLVLDEWFRRAVTPDRFDLIYVNGTNNLENLKSPGDGWRVELIEEHFLRLMFDAEGRP